MDRKVADSFWSTQEGGEKQTNKKGFKPLGSLTCFALMLKIQLLIKKSKKKCHKKLNMFSPIRYHFHKRWGQVPYYAPGFNALHLNMQRGTQWISEASTGSWMALVVETGLVCSPRAEADDNWNMKMHNKKQYMYFICAFELCPHFANYKRAKQIHNSRILCIN